ncbi:MAG: response regulator [Magnetospirillum sp.]|nr:response regulator [Magnetospirillum sp.]
MSTSPTPSLSQFHILIVDDDITVRDILARFLGNQGFTVTPCADGTEMWAAMAAKPVHLVVMDVEMPGEDGYTLAYRLRAANIGIGIIMLSSHTEMDHKVHGLGVGADDFMSKPCDRRELLARVKSLLRRSTLPSSPPPIPEAPAKATRPDNCPNCGSRMRYSSQSETGVIGICLACGLSKFYET